MRVRPQVREKNLKFIRIWSAIQIVYWLFCLCMSMRDEAYLRCRVIYEVSFALCTAALILTVFPGSKQTWRILPAAIATEASLLCAGVFIARNLAPKTIMVFASVLLAPIMFINSTMQSAVILLADIILFSLVGRRGMDPDTYGWTLTNMIIFSSVGALTGHFINKDRFERCIFAESAVRYAESAAKIAELQTKYAYYDQMTELRNRRSYAEKLDALANDIPPDCCVIMADVNGLKAMNDTLGHEAGDELIIGSAECLKQCFKDTDQIYRIGGDEFCVIMNGSEKQVEERLRQMEEIGRRWKGEYADGISLSYGFASAEEFTDLDGMLKAADRRMYEFKSNYYMKRQK
ncbi:MAG: GGDEF domain-containing protein [Oscillospiraceae bacterium]|nr:GGDEF domain-containing protein [Oscillospiraceae bacterium]